MRYRSRWGHLGPRDGERRKNRELVGTDPSVLGRERERERLGRRSGAATRSSGGGRARRGGEELGRRRRRGAAARSSGKGEDGRSSRRPERGPLG
ncbi:hypothetical protein PR202_ga14103 [Eleusine coracana subsp. coracana]|uniref:Uncharacterized protein n=1 Tax=Eleusine coracana subsp. coracana TaxID=191504 RepID=A0AAV5CGH9_ELECO|nr:hypothetical protein PR202_ga14103 [Eleusine coracana subsp. coracana]